MKLRCERWNLTQLQLYRTLNTVTESYPNAAAVALLPAHRIVTLSTTTDLLLSDPRYLKLHATICRVAHLSGVFGFLDTFQREMKERQVLAIDETSAEHLAWRLQGYSDHEFSRVARIRYQGVTFYPHQSKRPILSL